MAAAGILLLFGSSVKRMLKKKQGAYVRCNIHLNVGGASVGRLRMRDDVLNNLKLDVNLPLNEFSAIINTDLMAISETIILWLY